MTTSFNRTRTQLAQRVLGKVLKVGSVTQASADYETVYEAIDLRLKEFHKQGIFWRKVTSVPVSFSLTAAVTSVSAGAGDILFPLNMTWANLSRDDPVDIISSIEYAAIPDKNRAGNPTKALWKGGSEFLLWPVPTSNGTGKLIYEKLADDTSAGAYIDIESSMLRAFVDLIKYDVADDYGIAEQTQVRWKVEAREAERDIRKLNQQRITLSTVAVDDFHSYPRYPSDYGIRD